MSGRDEPTVDAELIRERHHLLSLAFRMLGTTTEAEDAVQETYIRWYRMEPAERDQVEVPRAWLTRVASRICLDMLGSAHARRERYIGPWLPEPVPNSTFVAAGVDPLDRVTLDDSVSTALLVVLESMTPAERVAFVLHDIFQMPFPEIAGIVGRSPAACRQLATSARIRVRNAPVRQVTRAEHDTVVRAFAAANRSGDLKALAAALDPNVVLRSDGGGYFGTARNPIYGADRVARFLFGALRKRPGIEMREQQTGDGLGFALWLGGRVVGVITLEVFGGHITHVRIVLNPEKLTLWHFVTAGCPDR